MMNKRLDQLRRVWATDQKMQRAGLPGGHYLRWFYKYRLASRFPKIFSTQRVAVQLSDREAARKASALIRINGGGGDLTVFSGLIGDREYWDSTLFPIGRLLDLGSNIGLAALWFSLFSPNMELACVEADPRNISLLTENLSRNNLQARIFACAVGAVEGEAELGINDHMAVSSLISTGLHGHKESVRVNVRTVESILDELGWESVDVVKMDIEGAELEIFRSCASWIERVERFVLEIHPNTSAEEIEALVRPFGRVVRRIGFGVEPTFIIEKAKG
jgi:FkbM family methyltransferase